jgi:hypothetical protein
MGAPSIPKKSNEVEENDDGEQGTVSVHAREDAPGRDSDQ